MRKLSRAQLAKAFVALVTDANQADLIRGLAYELVSTHRASEVELMLRDINRELLRQRRQIDVSVTSAHELDASLRAQLEAQLKTLTGAKMVRTQLRVDRSLLGGLIAETPDDRMDLSLRHKLESLEV